MRAYWRWLAVFGIWTALAMLSMVQTMFYLQDEHLAAVPMRTLIVGRLADWYTCAVFTPLFVLAVRRFPADRDHWHRNGPLLAVLVAVAVVLKYAMYVPLRHVVAPWPEPMAFITVLRTNFLMEAMIFGGLLAILHALEFSRSARERERVAASLRAELSEARLDALASQLHPHFLFNTLNGISALMHRDVPAADEMLSNLSDLLRESLRRDCDGLSGRSAHEVPLRQELALLERYLDIMRARIGARLSIAVEVDPAAADVMVPRFILQPLVENALQHGAGQNIGAAHVRVSAVTNRQQLEVCVMNDGNVKPDDGIKRKEGVGLSNTRRRLSALYGDGARFDAGPLATGGFEVRLAIPISS